MLPRLYPPSKTTIPTIPSHPNVNCNSILSKAQILLVMYVET